MNPSNGRASLARDGAPPQGAEYAVDVGEGLASIANGRTPREADAIACTCLWLDGAELGRVHTVGYLERGATLDELARDPGAIEPRLHRKQPG